MAEKYSVYMADHYYQGAGAFDSLEDAIVYAIKKIDMGYARIYRIGWGDRTNGFITGGKRGVFLFLDVNAERTYRFNKSGKRITRR